MARRVAELVARAAASRTPTPASPWCAKQSSCYSRRWATQFVEQPSSGLRF